MFIGRAFELAELEKMYEKDKFQLAIIYGRRRVGKTELINEFTKEKPTIYFQGKETSSKNNLLFLSERIDEFENSIDKSTTQGFANFAKAFQRINTLAENFDKKIRICFHRKINQKFV